MERIIHTRKHDAGFAFGDSDRDGKIRDEGKDCGQKENGKNIIVPTRPSMESMVWSLGHLTLTRLVEKGKRKAAHFSNWDAVSREVFSNIRADVQGKGMSFG